MQEDFGMNEMEALALMQHYGLPTPIVDFTCHLGHALTFAAHKETSVARICILPYEAASRMLQVQNLTGHPRADRPLRQAAFCVITDQCLNDFKSPAVRQCLSLLWVQFPVTARDVAYFRQKYERLMSVVDDPTAGIIRRLIIEYVESRKRKFSPTLTDWLVKCVPMVPWCQMLRSVEGDEAIAGASPADGARFQRLCLGRSLHAAILVI